MKKIKKILPLLLGVMVLMFGTLTVSAAEHTVVEATALKQFTAYIKDNNLKDYPYKALYRIDYPKASTYLYVVTDKPCSYKTGQAYTRGFYSNEDNTTFYVLIVNGDNVQVDKKGVIKTSGSYLFNVTGDGASVVASNYTVYYRDNDGISDRIASEKDNTGFFPIPPVAKVAEGLPEVVQNQTRVILITAVACLALLVILSVLPKKLPRFLNR